MQVRSLKNRPYFTTGTRLQESHAKRVRLKILRNENSDWGPSEKKKTGVKHL